MIIDKSAFEKLKFNLCQDHSDSTDNNNEIVKIIKKYNIMPSTNYLINSMENNYLVMINYILNLYHSQLPLNEDIVTMLKFNIEFKKKLLQDLKRRLKNLVTNNTTLLFKEINNVIHLLSLGKNYNIFETHTTYNFDEISTMFRDYENILKETQEETELFNLTFHCYTVLIDTFTQLCVVNSTDIKRKRTISAMIDILTESINMMKYTASLSENHINTLNNILGKLLYYFTHIPFYDVKTKPINYIIEEFHLNLNKQADGFHLSQDTNFGDHPQKKQNEFIQFKNNSSLLILSLIKKLEFHFKEIEFFSYKEFKMLMHSYKTSFSPLINNRNTETLESFKTKLLNSLGYTYKCNNTHKNMTLSYKEIIKNFIISGENYNHNNVEVIHNILLFAEDIEEYQYINIGDILLDSKVIKNDYYEFFKLKTFDIIINKLIETKSKKNIEPFIKTLILYIERHKMNSYLNSSFSKIYLSLSLYYSNKETPETLYEGKKFYSTFIDINGTDLLKKEYQRINSLILSNLGEYKLKT